MINQNTNKYNVFISYSHENTYWAKWFQHELETYSLPEKLKDKVSLLTNFHMVFRDIDELEAGPLREQIRAALATSSFLVVICSPESTKSEWVNEEVSFFIEVGKQKGIDNTRNIFPFIVDGVPRSQNEDEECFPRVLLNLIPPFDTVWARIDECGRDKAFIKIVAGMLPSVGYRDLWNRYEHEKAETEEKKKEERDKLLKAQSRYVAERAMSIVGSDSYLARLLALAILPKNLEKPERPYEVEAEQVLRASCLYNSAILRQHIEQVSTGRFSHDGQRA